MPQAFPPLLVRLFPFLGWPRPTAGHVRADLLAGVTVAMVLVPQSMAYAQLAGLPPHYGLYAAFLPGIVAALWGSSWHLATGPVAMTSLLTATTLGTVASVGSDRYLHLAIVLAAMVGILRLGIGLCRMAFVVNFLSLPVICGFTNAAAIVIAASQAHKLTGLDAPREGHMLSDLWALLRQLDMAHLPTLAVGLLALAALLLLRRAAPRFPAALAVAAAGTLAVWALGLEARGVAVIGAIPAGLPPVSLPRSDLAEIRMMLPGACAILLIGFLEVCAVSKAIATRSKQRIDFNQELVGQGLSAMVGALSHCFPTSGSFSRSALNHAAGAKSGLSAVFTGIVVLLTLLFLTPLLSHLPQAILAAIIIAAVATLIDFARLRHAWQVSRGDGLAGYVTFIATLALAPRLLEGILIGTALAIALHLHRMMRPRAVILGDHPDGMRRDADLHRLAIDPRLPSLRFDGRLFFASAAHFEETVLDVLRRFPEAQALIVVGDGINALDATGEEMLRDLAANLRQQGIRLAFAGLKHQVRSVFARTGLDRVIGEDLFFATEAEARRTLAQAPPTAH